MSTGVYTRSVCSYECQHVVRSHTTTRGIANHLRDGVGLQSSGLSYPGYEDQEGGFTQFARATETDTSELLEAVYYQHGITMQKCGEIFERHKTVVMHGIWIIDHTTATATRVGSCLFFLAARTRVQTVLWQGFYAYAREVLTLGHFENMFPDTVHSATQYPDDSDPCVSSTSDVCLYWSDVDVEDNLACFPKTDGSNVLTPAVILASIEEGKIRYPPPSPPPPSPPLLPPPPSPPPSSFTCTRNTLPTTEYRKTLNSATSTTWTKQQCALRLLKPFQTLPQTQTRKPKKGKNAHHLRGSNPRPAH